MENSKFQQLKKEISKYNKLRGILSFISWICAGLVFPFFDKTVILVILLIYMYATIFVLLKLKKKVGLLSAELLYADPEEYEKMLQPKSQKGKYVKDPHLWSSIKLYKGDIQESLRQGLLTLNDVNIDRMPEVKYYQFSVIAWCYFLAGDLENLSRIVSQLSPKEKDSKTVLKFKENYKKISLFYSNFIGKDYENCKAVCNTVLSNIDPIKEKIRYTMYSFLLAVSHYKMGEYDSAKELFEKVIDNYPNIVYAKSSRKYLEAMDNGTEYQPVTLQEIDSTTLETDAITKFRKQSRKIEAVLRCIYLFVIILSAVLGTFLNNMIDGKDFFGYYYRIEDCRLEKSEYYENGIVIANVKAKEYCFDFVINETEESLTIIRIKYKNDRFNYGMWFTSETRKSVQNIVSKSENAVSTGDKYLRVMGFDSEIYYLILPSTVQIPEDISETYTFQYDGEELILCIKHKDE